MKWQTISRDYLSLQVKFVLSDVLHGEASIICEAAVQLHHKHFIAFTAREEINPLFILLMLLKRLTYLKSSIFQQTLKFLPQQNAGGNQVVFWHTFYCEQTLSPANVSGDFP